MTLKNHLPQQINPASVLSRMSIGAAIGLAVISVFIFPVSEPNPEWGKLWRIRPLIVTPLAAAFGALSFFSTDIFRPKSVWLKAVLIGLSVFAFVFALWVGIILGLDGTLWD